jgi:hypothetical protein
VDALILAERNDGQNARWKAAADRLGGGLTALIYSAGQDLAGIGARYAAAAQRFAEGRLRIRSVHISDTYIRYPYDIKLQGNGGAVKRLYHAADVVHLNNTIHGWERFDHGQRKPVLLHHHGTIFRTRPRRLLVQARRFGFEQAASTVDLAAIAPEVISWLPTAYNLDELAALRDQHRRPDDGLVRIAHAPTNRTIKSTEALVYAIEQLKSEGLPVDLDLIERVTWAECLRRKAAADVYFDQVILGYGCNAVEAWGMGMPVVAGVDPQRAEKIGHPIPAGTRDLMLKEYGGSLPFYEANERNIADALRPLVQSADLRAHWAAKGMEHVWRFHAEAPALAKLVELYLRAIARREKSSRTVAA